MVVSMNCFRHPAIWWMLLSLGLQAQVDVKLEIPQQQFLPGERLEVAIRISNFTGRTLVLGAEPMWLRFQVETRAGMVVNQLSDPEESGRFEIGPVERGRLRYDLAPRFQLDQPGRYRVVAVVRLPGGEEVTSPPASFELIRGTRLADQPYGYNGPTGEERRKFILQQANYLKEVVLYVRCTDERESASFSVTKLGRTVSFTRPQRSLDAEGRWHVLHQFDRNEYRYHVFGPEGILLTRQTFAITDRRPEIRVNDEGKVAVIGGVRRVSADDFPAPVVVKVTEAELFTPDDKPKTTVTEPAQKR